MKIEKSLLNMDNIAEGMTLDDTRVRISPLVPSIILDYYMRNWKKEERKENSSIDHQEFDRKHNDYTIGVLLGQELETNIDSNVPSLSGSTTLSSLQKSIYITNAFGVRFDKTQSEFNKGYVDFMNKYLTKGTKESIVGMFHVSTKGQDVNDFHIMRAFSAIRDQQTGNNKWILLTIDGSMEKPSLNMKTFFLLDYDFGKTSENLCIFVDTPHEVITEDLTTTGLDTVLFGQENYDKLGIHMKEASEQASLTIDQIEDIKQKQKLFNSNELLKTNIKNITALLQNAKKYVDEVEGGDKERDPKIDRALNSALGKIAHITPESLEELLREHNQDLLYVGKLTSLIKNQLFISKKLASEIK